MRLKEEVIPLGSEGMNMSYPSKSVSNKEVGVVEEACMKDNSPRGSLRDPLPNSCESFPTRGAMTGCLRCITMQSTVPRFKKIILIIVYKTKQNVYAKNVLHLVS